MRLPDVAASHGLHACRRHYLCHRLILSGLLMRKHRVGFILRPLLVCIPRPESFSIIFTLPHVSGILALQARDDDFVPYKEGKALYETLQYLIEGSLEATEGSSSTSGSGAAESQVQSSEFVTISGGHCTGFLQAPVMMPAAVLTALDRLRAKHGL